MLMPFLDNRWSFLLFCMFLVYLTPRREREGSLRGGEQKSGSALAKQMSDE